MPRNDRLAHLDRTIADPGHAAPTADCRRLAVLEDPQPSNVAQCGHRLVIAR